MNPSGRLWHSVECALSLAASARAESRRTRETARSTRERARAAVERSVQARADRRPRNVV